MKKLILYIILAFMATACIPTNAVPEKQETLVDVQVNQWLKNHKTGDSEKLPVLVKSKRALGGYPFLKLVKNNFYGGHATYEQIQVLMKDVNILRIYATKQKPTL